MTITGGVQVIGNRSLACLICELGVFLFSFQAQSAPQVLTAEYKLPAQIDPAVLETARTELWAQIYFPKPTSAKPLPVIVFLHGNHATCSFDTAAREDAGCFYTQTGNCGKGQIPTPNHLGYEKSARALAQNGFFVISVNANLGITCSSGGNEDWGLNLARGRLLLRHLELWSKINRGLDTAPNSILSVLRLQNDFFVNRLDLGQVGMMGHSRGGEGVRAALNLYRDDFSEWQPRIPELNIKALYEVGAVDGQTGRELNPVGVAWNQLLPMCDGDVSDLQGREPFERMLKLLQNQQHLEDSPKPKSLQMVWGTNHNFYNTVWNSSDSPGCANHLPIFDPRSTGSEAQQGILAESLTSFMTAHVGRETKSELAQIFNPMYPLTNFLKQNAFIERDFFPGLSTSFSQVLFSAEPAVEPISIDATVKSRVIKNGEDGSKLELSWKTSGKYAAVTLPLLQPFGLLRNSTSATLDFRIQSEEILQNPLNVFFRLIDLDGEISQPVQLKDWAWIIGPGNAYVHTVASVRIPLAQFKGIDVSRLSALRVSFPPQTSGGVLLSQVLLSESDSPGAEFVQDLGRPFLKDASDLAPIKKVYHASKIRTKKVAFSLFSSPSENEISFESATAFAVLNSLPSLKWGNSQTTRGHLSPDLKTVTFKLTQEQSDSFAKEKGTTRIQFGAHKEWEVSPE